MSRLVLARKLDEEVVIHDNGKVLATVRLTQATNKAARLAFEAPDHIHVDRREIFESKYPDFKDE